MIEVRRYLTAGGKDVVGEWLARLRDNRARARIVIRLNRLSVGNFGDCKPLREGVLELRIDYGPGYRVYYSNLGPTCILLLCGGDKRTQSADIVRAAKHLQDYKQRSTT
ncbi:MAG: type II toxin-antitoxin system RelE/ParE family toxin [Candidatus Korobacteraceae bacterium]